MIQIFLSPHYDDVVYACGELVRQKAENGDSVRVTTVFAGRPAVPTFSSLAVRLHSEWGVEDPFSTRATEDSAALAMLGCEGEHWDCTDAIYRRGPNGRCLYTSYQDLYEEIHPLDEMLVEEIFSRLQFSLSTEPRGATIIAPLGLGGHVDHRIVTKAAGRLHKSGFRVLFYEDQPYAATSPGELAKVLFLNRDECWKPHVYQGKFGDRLRAIACYASQGKGGWVSAKIGEYARSISSNGRPSVRLWEPMQRNPVPVHKVDGIFACARCGGTLRIDDTEWQCSRCNSIYPVRFGVPDLRISNSEMDTEFLLDVKEAEKLWSIYESTTYEGLLANSSKNSPLGMISQGNSDCRKLTEMQVEKLMTGLIAHSQKTCVDAKPSICLDFAFPPGVGALALLPISSIVVAVGFSLSDLICARKLLERYSCVPNCALVAASVDALPFPTRSSVRIVSLGLSQRAPVRTALLREAYRVLKRSGVVLLSIKNECNRVCTYPYSNHSASQALYVRVRNITKGLKLLSSLLPTLWRLRLDIRRILPEGTSCRIDFPEGANLRQPGKTHIASRIRALARILLKGVSQLSEFEIVITKDPPPVKSSSLKTFAKQVYACLRFSASTRSALWQYNHLVGWLLHAAKNKDYRSIFNIMRVILVRLLGGICSGTKDTVTCEPCGWRGKKFLPFTDRGVGFLANEVCPNCGCWSRHRTFWSFLKHQLVGHISTKFRVLEIGPNGPLEKLIRTLPESIYVGMDLQALSHVYILGNATAMPFKDNSFDFVICSNVLCEIPDDKNAVDEMGRVCRRGGKVVLSDVIDDHLQNTVEFGAPRPDKHGAIRWYGRDFAQRFGSDRLSFYVDLYAFQLPSETVQCFGLSRRRLFIAQKHTD